MLPAARTAEKKSGLAYWAQRVLEECDKAAQDFAPDPVHDLRVAIRRCRSMADGFMSVDPDPAWKQMKKLAKPLFSALGELRDMQVMDEWVQRLSEESDPVRHTLLDALRSKEDELKAAAQHALHAFDRKRWSELNLHLARRTGRVPMEGPVFQHLALERWIDAYALHRQAMRNRSQTGYHQLRIGIKRFRYTLENFLPQRHGKWAKDLRDLQDALGEVHDLDVLRAILRAHTAIPPAEVARWQARITSERQKRLDLYRQKMLGKDSLWQVWRAELPRGVDLERAAMLKLRTWASFLDPDFRRTQRVTRLALQFYDGLAKQKLAGADPGQRRILEAAAMVHEVGRRKGTNGHRKRALRLLDKLKPPLGWTAEDLRATGAVARFHRGALPGQTSSYFVGVAVKRRSGLLLLAGILRLANAFDDGDGSQLRSLAVERRDGVLLIYANGLRQPGPAAERLARARHLLETTCGLPILLRPISVPPGRRRRSPAPPATHKPKRTSA